MYSKKIAALARGAKRQIGPADLLVLINGLAYSWLLSPLDLLRADGSDPESAERLRHHRAAIVEAARRMCEPEQAPPPQAGDDRTPAKGLRRG